MLAYFNKKKMLLQDDILFHVTLIEPNRIEIMIKKFL